MTFWPQIDCPGRKIGYARVSTKDQRLRMQRQHLKAVSCDLIFEDHGVSGAKAERPGLDALLDEIKPTDTLFVLKLDRLGRSTLQLADLLVRFRDNDIGFVSLSEGINTTTPGGKLVYHMFAAFAEFQRDVIVENTTCGIEAARRAGKTLGRPRKMTPERAKRARHLIECKGLSIAQTATLCGVSAMTVRRALDWCQ